MRDQSLRSHPTDHLPADPNWGKGVTRRAIGLVGTPFKVDAALEDMRHAMTCTLEHDGKVVTAVTAGFHRYTLQICPGASQPLQAMVGLPLDISISSFFANGRARQNCTHMLDLAWLAMRHAKRGPIKWTYEIAIPDATSGPLRGTLTRNGIVAQDWTVENDIIMSPDVLAGQKLSGGFTRWLTNESALPDLTVEECLILHKGFFMVGARRFTMLVGDMTENYKAAVTGACFGYAPERIDEAIALDDMGRDFSTIPEKLLKFE